MNIHHDLHLRLFTINQSQTMTEVYK